MAEKIKIVIVDWREYGDYSAVGQLTEKIFSNLENCEILSVVCSENRKTCSLFKIDSVNKLTLFMDKNHDSILHYIKTFNPNYLYIRLSPHLGTLEMGLKIKLSFHNNLKLLTHYMDVPHLEELNNGHSKYIEHLYGYLIKYSDRVYVIDQSFTSMIYEQYKKNAYALGNFATNKIIKSKIIDVNSNKKIKLAYFGSIDKKMNAAALSDICSVLANKDWIQIDLWTNSGLWGDIKETVNKSNNINTYKSNISKKKYIQTLNKYDILLLPYNNDEKSVEFLRHSFSNKLVDYMDSNSSVLVYGAIGIPTIDLCNQYKLGLFITNIKDLETKTLNKKLFINEINSYVEKSYIGYKVFSKVREKNLYEFYNYLRSEQKEMDESFINVNYNKEDSFNQKLLALLIRRKLYDVFSGQQSVVSNSLSSILKKHGYQGFEYEV